VKVYKRRIKPGHRPPEIRTFFTLEDDTNVMKVPPLFSSIIAGDLIHNPPVISLIIANIITIVLAITENWDLATVMFIYWAQSVIIGIFTVVSLLGADTAILAAEMEKPVRERGGMETVTPRFVWLY